MAKTKLTTDGNPEWDAMRACSRITAEFISCTDRADLTEELDTVRKELGDIKRKAPDWPTALLRMQTHLSKRVLPRWDQLRTQNGCEDSYCQSALKVALA